MLDPSAHCELWPHPWNWPWIFKVKFWYCHISGMAGPTDLEWKGWESIECWTHYVSLNFDLTHDLDLGFSRSDFKIAIFQAWEGSLTLKVRDVRLCVDRSSTHYVVLKNFYLTHDLDLWFSRSNFEIAVSEEWESPSTWDKSEWECFNSLFRTVDS